MSVALAADSGPIAAPSPMQPVPFKEAIAWAKSRSVQLPDVYYGELQGLARAMSFSIAGLAKLDQLQAVKDSLIEALETGETLRDWQKRVRSGAIGLDLPAHRLENIFRTNIQGNYARGRCEQQKRTAEAFPWYMYDATNDSRTRPAHAAMDGKVARHDDPVWKVWYPPCGYSCFLPGTLVSGDFEIGLKAWYSGRAVEIIATHGSRLSVTVNHPILTSKGWIKAGQLKEGDDLLGYQCRIDGGVGAPIVGSDGSLRDVDDEQAPFAVEQIFDALAAQRFGRADRAAFDLYGDALDFKGHVQVVGAASELMDGVYADGMQSCKDGPLNVGDHVAVGFRDEQLNPAGASFTPPVLKIVPKFFQALFDERLRHTNRIGNFFATSALIKHLRQLFVEVCHATPLGAFPSRLTLALNRLAVFLHHAPFQRFGLALATQRDAMALQPVADSLPAGSKVVRYGLEAFPSNISGDQACRVFRRPSGVFHGPTALDSVSVLRRAAFDSVVAQQPAEHAVTDAALFEQLAHGCTGLIKRDKVAGVRHFSFSGHVYDFQTANGLISANGIITSNCRCRVISLTDKQAARFQAVDAKRMQDPELADARASAKPDKGWDYSVCSDPTEGIRRAVEAKRPRTDHLLMGAHDEAVAVEARRIAAVKAAIEAARDDCLAFGKANNRERMILIDDVTGRELGRADGTQSSVAFTGEMNRILQDPHNSVRIVHNHPSSGSLSLPDLIAVYVHKGSSAIEAIGHDGSLYIGGAASGGIADGVTYPAAIKAVQIAFMPEVVAGNMSAHQAGDMFWHATNTALAQAGIISYRAILSVRRQETLDGLGEAFDAAVKAAVAAIKKQAKP